MKDNKLKLLNDNELAAIKGGGDPFYVPGYGYTNLIGEVTVYGDPSIVQLKEYAWSGTDNRLVYFFEAGYNGFVLIYNGYAKIVNRF